jgi:hypothetical protein
MFSRTYLAISGAKVSRAVVHGEPPLQAVNARAVNLFLPNLGVGRLVLRSASCGLIFKR